MLRIDYQIIVRDYDAVPGESGHFQITCGPLQYGEFWPPEISMHMATYRLRSWFLPLAEALLALKEEGYAAFIDTERYRGWLEFTCADGLVRMNIADAEATEQPFFLHRGRSERFPDHVPRVFPDDVSCPYRQLRDEIAEKTARYLSEIRTLNPSLFSGSATPDREQEAFLANISRLESMLADMMRPD